MGQSASLYRIDKSDFSKIPLSPNNFKPYKIKKGLVTFEQSFEGLIFVLSKGLSSGDKNLIEEIFYPACFIGERPDFATLDLANLPEGFDFEDRAISYNGPDKLEEIFRVLNRITETDFSNNFDYQELNEQGIYPAGAWNDKTDPNTVFNLRHMLEEFQSLKAIIETARNNGDFVLSYVG